MTSKIQYFDQKDYDEFEALTKELQNQDLENIPLDIDIVTDFDDPEFKADNIWYEIESRTNPEALENFIKLKKEKALDSEWVHSKLQQMAISNPKGFIKLCKLMIPQRGETKKADKIKLAIRRIFVFLKMEELKERDDNKDGSYKSTAIYKEIEENWASYFKFEKVGVSTIKDIDQFFQKLKKNHQKKLIIARIITPAKSKYKPIPLPEEYEPLLKYYPDGNYCNEFFKIYLQEKYKEMLSYLKKDNITL